MSVIRICLELYMWLKEHLDLDRLVYQASRHFMHLVSGGKFWRNAFASLTNAGHPCPLRFTSRPYQDHQSEKTLQKDTVSLLRLEDASSRNCCAREITSHPFNHWIYITLYRCMKVPGTIHKRALSKVRISWAQAWVRRDFPENKPEARNSCGQ